jgi:hypothetical protein
MNTAKIIKFKLIFVFLITFLPLDASAIVSPIGLAMFPEFQLPPRDSSVAGLRMSVFWGENKKVYGLDIGGIGNKTTGKFVGTAVSGVFNLTEKTTIVGLQVAGITNISKGDSSIVGVQLSAIANINGNKSHLLGLQASLYNKVAEMSGVQIGAFNKADILHGVQIGLVNSAKSLYGVQIGLINVSRNGLFGVFPVFNLGF